VLWYLAGSALRHRPLRTFLTALGISVAVGSTIVFLSLGEGFRRIWTEEIGGIGPDLQVSLGPFDASSITSLPQVPLDTLAQLDEVRDTYGITGITPLLFHVRGGLDPSRTFVFQGWPTDIDISDLYGNVEVVAGRELTSADSNAFVAVIGARAAERSRLELGDQLRLNPSSIFTIVGIADATGGILDTAVLVPLAPLQEALGITDRVTMIALDLAEPGRATEIAAALGERFPDLGFQTRGDVLGVIEEGIRISDVLRLGISSIALIVGAIAVANTMLMSVFERTREFGVVRAVGARPRFLFGLVLIESVLLSLVGAAVGMLIGRVGIVVVNRVADNMIGIEVASLTLRLALFAVAVAIGMGLLSGLLPAARAANIPIAVAVARE
jgi:putative ABC transport system permease protein